MSPFVLPPAGSTGLSTTCCSSITSSARLRFLLSPFSTCPSPWLPPQLVSWQPRADEEVQKVKSTPLMYTHYQIMQNQQQRPKLTLPLEHGPRSFVLSTHHCSLLQVSAIDACECGLIWLNGTKAGRSSFVPALLAERDPLSFPFLADSE